VTPAELVKQFAQIAIVVPPSGYITPAWLQKYLGVGVRTLERWRAEGKGPKFRKRGRLNFYHIDDVAEWLNQQQQ